MDLSSLTLSQLRYLVALDERRSFREAAHKVHVSQPALSMQIRKLEGILGEPLFDRSRQPIVPTQTGERVLAQARRVLHEAARIEEVLRPDTLRGRYRLGIIPTLADSLLPRLLPRFARDYPEVDLRVIEMKTDELIDGLLRDAVDGGLAATPVGAPGVKERRIYDEPFCAYLSEGHPLSRRRSLRQADLYEEPVWLLSEGHCARTQALHLCRVHRPNATGPAGTASFEGGSFSTLMSLVDAGLGLTIIPELTARNLSPARRKARVRPFVRPHPSREISLLHARTHLHAAIADALVETARAVVPAELVSPAPARRETLAPV